MESTSVRKSLTLNTDGCLVASFVGMKSVTFRTVCSMTFDKTWSSKYSRQTEETDTHRQRGFAQIRRKYSRKFGQVSTTREVSNIEMRKTTEPIFIYWCLTDLSVSPHAAFPVGGFLTEWWNTHDVTVNEVLYNPKFCNIERVNGLRETRETFHCAECYFEGNSDFLLSENL